MVESDQTFQSFLDLGVGLEFGSSECVGHRFSLGRGGCVFLVVGIFDNT
jgi:hypothetical protein